AAEEMIGGFTDDMVIEMIAQASIEGREISPTLAGLVGKLSKAKSQVQSTAAAGQQSDGSKTAEDSRQAAIILPEHMQKLFDREKYEDYVSKDYDAMLRKMSAGSAVARSYFPLEEHKKSLEDARLDFQIGRALLAFMEENIDEEDYKEFAQKLITIMPGFLETGNFELLWDISETLRRHTTEKPVKGIRTLAEKSRQIFADSEFRFKVLKAFDKWMKDKGQEAVGLVQALGADTVPGLLDIYSRDASVGGRRLVFNLLCTFGDRAVSEAYKRLHDSRPYYVRNLLILIRRAGNKTSVPYVKPLLKHKDQKVRFEALSTLLHFKDPAAVKRLRDKIRSKDPDIASQAVALAGQYHVHEVTEDILSRLKRVILFEADYTVNEEIIAALGEIGDTRAITDLEKLARASWSLYPQGLMRMKEILFESLERYPQGSIGNLLKIGEHLSSEKIRIACRRLMERK
ncbi:MAG TPA: HEAT repeat domain-containing protein, partial [Nitrospirota bacterium]